MVTGNERKMTGIGKGKGGIEGKEGKEGEGEVGGGDSIELGGWLGRPRLGDGPRRRCSSRNRIRQQQAASATAAVPEQCKSPSP